MKSGFLAMIDGGNSEIKNSYFDLNNDYESLAILENTLKCDNLVSK